MSSEGFRPMSSNMLTIQIPSSRVDGPADRTESELVSLYFAKVGLKRTTHEVVRPQHMDCLSYACSRLHLLARRTGETRELRVTCTDRTNGRRRHYGCRRFQADVLMRCEF